MSDQAKKNYDAVMGAVQRRAMEIVAAPVSQREAMFKKFRDTYYQVGIDGGQREASCRRFADEMDQFIRAMVGIIEQGGGAAGGTA